MSSYKARAVYARFWRKILAAAQLFVAFSDIKFCVTIDSGFRIVTCVWTDGAILPVIPEECERAKKYGHGNY